MSGSHRSSSTGGIDVPLCLVCGALRLGASVGAGPSEGMAPEASPSCFLASDIHHPGGLPSRQVFPAIEGCTRVALHANPPPAQGLPPGTGFLRKLPAAFAWGPYYLPGSKDLELSPGAGVARQANRSSVFPVRRNTFEVSEDARTSQKPGWGAATDQGHAERYSPPCHGVSLQAS